MSSSIGACSIPCDHCSVKEKALTINANKNNFKITIENIDFSLKKNMERMPLTQDKLRGSKSLRKRETVTIRLILPREAFLNSMHTKLTSFPQQTQLQQIFTRETYVSFPEYMRSR